MQFLANGAPPRKKKRERFCAQLNSNLKADAVLAAHAIQ